MALLSTPLQYLTSIPVATRALAALTVTLTVAYALLVAYSFPPQSLTVVPAVVLYSPWTLLTGLFVETSILWGIISLVFLVPAFRYFERLWGAIELLKFVIITGVISNAIAVFLAWLGYVAIGFVGYDMPQLLQTNYFGMTAVQTGILVAFTQLIPEHQVQVLGVLRLRVKRIPMIYVTISTVLCIVGFMSPWILIQFGWLVSWVYLRFYKKNGSESGAADTYGDRSETFALIHWFPPFLHYPIGMASNVVYSVAVKLHVIRPFATSPLDVEAGISAPGGARAEAERRRAMALKALDQRASAGVSTSNPAVGTSEVPINREEVVPMTREDDVKGKGKAIATDPVDS